jgi:hypothetical protein
MAEMTSAPCAYPLVLRMAGYSHVTHKRFSDGKAYTLHALKFVLAKSDVLQKLIGRCMATVRPLFN